MSYVKSQEMAMSRMGEGGDGRGTRAVDRQKKKQTEKGP